MVETVQEMIARKKLFVDVKRKMREEDKLRITLRKPVLSRKVKVRGARVSQIARKAVSLVAPKGGFVKAITTDTKKKKRGRGRPKGTYKVRYLPSGRAVKVPTYIYKKMLAAEKTQMRLAAAQRQQIAEQIAREQDPRFQQGVEEQFLAEPDQAHELDVVRAKAGYPIQVQEPGQPVLQRVQGIGSRFIRGISSIGGVRARPEQVVDQYGRTMPVRPQPQPQPQGQGLIREPQVSLFGAQSNILNAPNIFNKPGESTLLLPKRRSRTS